ncbi:hypothetical protein [Aquimarina algicola]|uniref:Uncharacterized protein n=1 Tax=Aquimarina algicola TaxID=2589995 RepID=A0A504J683_9FLAO|nr:hypothetical protein [Aquimarina algicola]TPN86317.1 hypothetical protein FHK87_13710 [Aquimarina algicola]
MITTKEELIVRWDTFLNKIEQRFDDILEQAQQGTTHLVSQIEYDSGSIGSAWSGIKGQLYELREKADHTWENKMDGLFGDRDDVTSKERIEQFNKYEDLSHRMENRYNEAQVKAMADAGRKIYDNVMQHINTNKIHNCKQCGDQMDIVVYSFMAKNIKCHSCGTVNSYEPDPRIQALEHYTIGALADEHVIDLVIKEANLEHDIHRLHDLRNEIGTEEKKNDLRKILVTTRQERIRQYYEFMETNVPDKASYYARQKEERLKWAENTKHN